MSKSESDSIKTAEENGSTDPKNGDFADQENQTFPEEIGGADCSHLSNQRRQSHNTGPGNY